MSDVFYVDEDYLDFMIFFIDAYVSHTWVICAKENEQYCL